MYLSEPLNNRSTIAPEPSLLPRRRTRRRWDPAMALDAAQMLRDSPLRHDFTNDGIVNQADIDAFTAALIQNRDGGGHQREYDLNGDGAITINDLD